jgi:hypothetical protein
MAEEDASTTSHARIAMQQLLTDARMADLGERWFEAQHEVTAPIERIIAAIDADGGRWKTVVTRLVAAIKRSARDYERDVKQRARDDQRARAAKNREQSLAQTEDESGRPVVFVCEKQDRDLLEESWAVLAGSDTGACIGPGGRICHLAGRDGEGWYLAGSTANAVRAHLAESATWRDLRPSGDSYDVPPPLRIASMMVDRPRFLLPQAHRVQHSPFFTREGELVVDDGLHSSGVWVKAGDLRDLQVNAPVLRDEVDGALDILGDLLHDFPFAEESDRANALAFALTPLVRMMISGRCPMFLFTGPNRGMGKTLIPQLIVTIHEGMCSMSAWPTREEEVEKRITAMMAEGRSFLFFDNADKGIKSPSLSAAVTSPYWTGRILGTSNNAKSPNEATWVFTGRNPGMSDETARRIVRVQLSASKKRTTYRIHNIEKWVQRNRAELFRALVVLVAHWLQEGCPKPSTRPREGFREWSEVVGGILEAAGVQGFLEGQEDTGGDVDEEPIVTLLTAWADAHGAKADRWSASRICDWARTHREDPDPKAPYLLELLELNEVSMLSFGRLIAQHEGGIFAGFVLEKSVLHRTNVWSLVPDPSTATVGDQNPPPDRNPPQIPPPNTPDRSSVYGSHGGLG